MPDPSPQDRPATTPKWADRHYDLVVVGAGPAGQNAAIQAARSGRDVLVIERGREIGGACVHLGTIPSKTMREVAAQLLGLKERLAGGFQFELPESLRTNALLQRLDEVIRANERSLATRFGQDEVTFAQGIARFESSNRIRVQTPRSGAHSVTAEVIVIAAGSRPRLPDNVEIDHDRLLDSDSVLTMTWLPRSLAVLGGGVIACEYASTFAALGCEVTIIDRAPRPLMFLDSELSNRFVNRFERFDGCRYLGSQTIERASRDRDDSVVVELSEGEPVRAERLLCALGRVANLDSIGLEAVGLSVTSRGLLEVDEFCRTRVPSIYAVGDVIGAPALASSAMEQGRRAVRHAFGLEVGSAAATIPTGIYTVPSISTVGLSEAEAVERHGGAICGEAQFDEVARAQIAGCVDGYLKLICCPEGRKILGVQVFGEGATELVHVGQFAIAAGFEVEALLENVFNFPTLHEAYRLAALDVVRRRDRAPAAAR
jgi:NAD(P) transhydrogenase